MAMVNKKKQREPKYCVFLYPLLNTEISSIFYVLKFWIPKKTVLFNLNAVLFYLTFCKFRIYDFYGKLIQNNAPFDVAFPKYSQFHTFPSSVLILSCYGLFILNIYWFLIIHKILYKSVVKFFQINTDTVCHFLCCYIHWFNIPLSIYLYSYKQSEKYLLDLVGITALSVSSYIYHNDIYNRLSDKQIENYDIPSKENIVFFLNDSIFIHVRSFLVVATNYYTSPHLSSVLFLSGFSHISSIYHGMTNILNLFIDREQAKESFLNCHNILMALPIVCDVFLIFIHSSKETAIPFVFVNIIIGLLFVIEPFYKLTHVAFHICLIAQNYYMCLSNSK